MEDNLTVTVVHLPIFATVLITDNIQHSRLEKMNILLFSVRHYLRVFILRYKFITADFLMSKSPSQKASILFNRSR